MRHLNQKGFSLVELLIALAISGVVATTVIGFFISQQRSHTSQEQVTFMQQNMRAGLGIMSRELRMAGYNPTNQTTVDLGFSAPGLNTTTFTLDFHGLETDGIDNDGDGTVDEADEWLPDGDANDSDEQITYSLNANSELLRNGTVMADGIEALAFGYAYDSDTDGELDTDAGGDVIFAIAGNDGLGPLDDTVNWYRINADGSTTDTGTLANAADIRAVRIWLLATTDVPDSNYSNPDPDIVGSQVIPAGGQRRKRLLDTVVRCRNMGLVNAGL